MHGVDRLRCSPICDFEWQLRVADFRAVEVASGSETDSQSKTPNVCLRPVAVIDDNGDISLND